MGHILELSCSDCYYKESFFLGAGMLYNNLEIVKEQFNETEVKKINTWLNWHKTDRFNADTVLAFCKECGRFEAMPLLTFYSSKKEKEFCNTCTDCGKQLDRIGNETEIPCPKCGCILHKENIGNWD